jgi:hypothetical protein
LNPHPARDDFKLDFGFARPLVQMSLNATSFSTRISPGSPSTRSPMMFRRISSDPPSIRVAGERTAESSTAGRPSISASLQYRKS